MRVRGWVIDLFLWVCPLMWAAAFIVGMLSGDLQRRERYYPYAQFFDVPVMGRIPYLVIGLGLPLIVAVIARRVFGFLAVVSLVILLAGGAGWWHSRTHSTQIDLDYFREEPHGPTVYFWNLRSEAGGVGLFYGHGGRHVNWLPWGRKRAITHQQLGGSRYPPSDDGVFGATPQRIRDIGFAMMTEPTPDSSSSFTGYGFALALPYWFLCLLAIPLPLAWAVRFRRRRRVVRRALAGQCVGCGYDLRATPDPTGARLAVCPECGEARR